MKYSYEEGNFKQGDILSIQIDRRANIYLLDRLNFNRYKSNQTCEYYGGTSNTSPYNIKVPRTGHWYIVIDLGRGVSYFHISVIHQ